CLSPARRRSRTWSPLRTSGMRSSPSSPRASAGRRRRRTAPPRLRSDEPRMSRRTALAAVCAVLFLTFLDNTILGVALADMQTSLRAGVPALQWIVDGYMLAFTALMLTGGTLGDLLGRKKVMLAGIALFCGGSLFGALAGSSRELIAARVVMGVGAA